MPSIRPSDRGEPKFTGDTPYSLHGPESGPGIGPGGDEGGHGQAPIIVDFACTSGSTGSWVFSGRVIDDTPAGLTVSLGGAPASLQNQTAITNAGGYFSRSFVLQTNGSDVGIATADTTDLDGNPSNTAECSVNP